MQLSTTQVLAIYLLHKERLLQDGIQQQQPIAIVLGGQPASGKSGVIKQIQNNDISALVINGDEYRQYHPDCEHIMQYNPVEFPTITQNFSNIFTKHLIQDATVRQFNMIIEGTMRNPDVPAKTASMLRIAGYKVGIAVIAAHPKITELGIYRRYVEEVETVGYGRLSNITSHNVACAGLLTSVDTLYNTKVVDFIHIYSYLGNNKLTEYELNNGEWNNLQMPSQVIDKARKIQIENTMTLKQHINFGKETAQKLNNSPIIKSSVLHLVTELSVLVKKKRGMRL
ncbi:hypothetical protein FACS189456_2910 [Bacteroidia bacterium]|nr:hypothetical protein FACS189456_2910 [Bacteroidia bacterium]